MRPAEVVICSDGGQSKQSQIQIKQHETISVLSIGICDCRRVDRRVAAQRRRAREPVVPHRLRRRDGGTVVGAGGHIPDGLERRKEET